MKPHLNSVIITIGIILAAAIIGAAYKFKFTADDTITVTGSAEKNFSSDLIVWNGSFSRSDTDLKSAYASLKADETTIKQYLQRKGLNTSEVIFSAIDINKNYTTRYDENGRATSSVFSGYTLSQQVKIESKNIDKVETISREITELIENGIELNSQQPAYYYTQLSALKISLLADASKDAKTRAESIAENAGNNLGDLKTAAMGVFQITGQNSNEDYSYGGAFNTTSKNKTATITLRTVYKIE